MPYRLRKTIKIFDMTNAKADEAHMYPKNPRQLPLNSSPQYGVRNKTRTSCKENILKSAADSKIYSVQIPARAAELHWVFQIQYLPTQFQYFAVPKYKKPAYLKNGKNIRW